MAKKKSGPTADVAASLELGARVLDLEIQRLAKEHRGIGHLTPPQVEALHAHMRTLGALQPQIDAAIARLEAAVETEPDIVGGMSRELELRGYVVLPPRDRIPSTPLGPALLAALDAYEATIPT